MREHMSNKYNYSAIAIAIAAFTIGHLSHVEPIPTVHADTTFKIAPDEIQARPTIPRNAPFWTHHIQSALIQNDAAYPDVRLSFDDVACLHHVIYNEARGEGPQGQIGVAQAALYRWNAAQETLCENTRRHYQFSNIIPVIQKTWDIEDSKAAVQIAIDVLQGRYPDTIGCADHFITLKRLKSPGAPEWTRQFTKTATVANHAFFRNRARNAEPNSCELAKRITQKTLQARIQKTKIEIR